MTRDEFWDAFKAQDVIVRTNTRRKVKELYAAAASRGMPVGATDYPAGDFPWSIFYKGVVTGWTGVGIPKAEAVEHLTFAEWQAIESGAEDVEIVCSSLEGVL